MCKVNQQRGKEGGHKHTGEGKTGGGSESRGVGMEGRWPWALGSELSLISPPPGCSLGRATDPLEMLLHLFIPGHNSFTVHPWTSMQNRRVCLWSGIIYWIWEPEKVRLELAWADNFNVRSCVVVVVFPHQILPFQSFFTLQTLLSYAPH